MSPRAAAHRSRFGLILISIAALLAASLSIVGPAAASAPSEALVANAGQVTPIPLGPGTPSATKSAIARPFLTLDPGALRAAKLRAAAAASTGARQPIAPLHTPLAGIFNNTNSPGLSQLTVAPPDSTGAIGPNNYVEMVNQQIGVYDRNLNLLSSSDNGVFMGVPGGLSVSDPQVQWDGQGQHWLYAALGVATGSNMLLFGWSKTADPTNLTSGWCLFGISRGNLLDDYPKLGHDSNFLSVGTNVYDDTGGVYNFITANIWAIRKPLAGDASCTTGTATYVADAAHLLHNADGSTAFTPVPANTADASPNGYIVAAHSPIDGVGPSAPKIMVWHWALSGGSPSLVSDGDVAISSFDIPASVPQPGTTYTLDSLDARLTQAVAINDPSAGGAKGIWTQHTVAGPGGRSVVRWYEILGGTPATLRQQGDVSSPTDFVFNGAVSPTMGGSSAAVFYSRAGASTLAVIGARSRSSATPLGSLDAGELVIGQSSAADLDFTCNYNGTTAPCRWGDYAGASPDPVNAGVVWGSNQLTGPCVILCGFFAQWQTQNFAVVASTSSGPFAPGAPNLNAPTAGNGSVGLTWSAPSSDGGASITDYAVYRGTTSGGEAFLANTGGALSFNDTGLTNGQTYYYTVAAINSVGPGAQSNERSATPTGPPPPDFSLAVTPPSRTISRGGSTAYTVTVSAANGFTGFVSLSSSISPSANGATMSFNPTGLTLGSSASSTLTVTTAKKTARHTYTITVTATSGSITHSTTVTLILR